MQIRKVVGPGENLAAALEPVLCRHTLQRGDDRPLDARHRVPPWAPSLLFWKGPPVGHTGSADERRHAIDDQQLAMGAIVDSVERVPANRLVRLNAAPRRAKTGDGPSPQAEAADRIDDDRDVDAVARAFAERVDEPLRHPSGVKDVALHVDRARRGTDRLEHRFVEHRTVGEDRHLVAVVQRRLTGGLNV